MALSCTLRIIFTLILIVTGLNLNPRSKGKPISTLFYIFLAIFISSTFMRILAEALSIPVPAPILTAHAFTASVPPPDQCPLSADDRDKHIGGIYGYLRWSCPEGTSYLCQEVSEYLVEDCFPLNICPRGTMNVINFDPVVRNASLGCQKCPEHYVQPYEQSSDSDFIPGCLKGLTPYMYINLDKMYRIVEGKGIDYDQYVCDSSKGYSEVRGNTICNITILCNCDKTVVCDNIQRPVLLPNGECDRPCAVDRINLFHCSQYESIPSTEGPSPLVVADSSQASSPSSVFGSQVMNNFTTEGIIDSASTQLATWKILAGVVIGVFILAVVIILLICCLWPRLKNGCKGEIDGGETDVKHPAPIDVDEVRDGNEGKQRRPKGNTKVKNTTNVERDYISQKGKYNIMFQLNCFGTREKDKQKSEELAPETEMKDLLEKDKANENGSVKTAANPDSTPYTDLPMLPNDKNAMKQNGESHQLHEIN